MKNKNEFLRKLGYELRLLNEKERTEHLSFYKERFNDALINGTSEKDVIEQLEDPKLIAKNIYDIYGIDDRHAQSTSSGSNNLMQIIGLIVFDVLFISWALPVAISVPLSTLLACFTFPFIVLDFAGMSSIQILLNVAFSVGAYVLLFLGSLFFLNLGIKFLNYVIDIHQKVFFPNSKKFDIKINLFKLLKLDKINWKFLVIVSLVIVIFTPILAFLPTKDVVTKPNESFVETFSYEEDLDINIQLINTPVIFKSDNVSEIKVKVESIGINHIIIRKKGNTISIYDDQLRKKKFGFSNWGINPLTMNDFNFINENYDVKITIIVPKEQPIDTLSIENVSSSINITNFLGEAITINSVSGDVYLGEVLTNKIEISSVSADIELVSIKNVRHGIEIESVSGDVDIVNVYESDIEIDSVSGDAIYQCDDDSRRAKIEFNSISGTLKTN